MFNLDSKTDSEWMKKIEEIKEEHTDKVIGLQKLVDQSKYEAKNSARDVEKMEHVLRHVLAYFLVERKIEVSERDKQLFYLNEIFDKYSEDDDE